MVRGHADVVIVPGRAETVVHRDLTGVWRALLGQHGVDNITMIRASKGAFV